MSETNTLLLEIQIAEGCSYLSDLHANCCQLSETAKLQIRGISLAHYSLGEWNEAASYITGQKCFYPTAEEARDNIIKGGNCLVDA